MGKLFSKPKPSNGLWERCHCSQSNWPQYTDAYMGLEINHVKVKWQWQYWICHISLLLLLHWHFCFSQILNSEKLLGSSIDTDIQQLQLVSTIGWDIVTMTYIKSLLSSNCNTLLVVCPLNSSKITDPVCFKSKPSCLLFCHNHWLKCRLSSFLHCANSLVYGSHASLLGIQQVGGTLLSFPLHR